MKRFTLRTLFIILTLMCLYVGSYLALRDPLVKYDYEGKITAGGDLHFRLKEVYRSDLPAAPDKITILCAVCPPRYRYGGQIARVVFAPAAWVETQFRLSEN